MRKLAQILLLSSIITPAFCQPGWQNIKQELENSGELYSAFLQSELENIDNPFTLPGFDRIENDSVFLYISKKDSSFLKKNLQHLYFPNAPSRRYRPGMTDDFDEVFKGKAYPTYPLYLEIMEYFRDSFPNICTIDTIGYSIHNRLILAARLSDAESVIDELPVGFYSSTIHGDETAGFVFMIMLIHHFLTGDDPVAQEIIENMIVIINPLANPDGTYFISDSTVFGATRGNSAGIDLNRNFPDPEDGLHPDGNDRQPETKAMMEYMKLVRPSISANFHGGAEVVNYPFDTWVYKHADDDWFRFISLEYSGFARSMLPAYMDRFPGGITNGYQWYQLNGGRQDYVSYFLRGRETTIELSNTKLLPEHELFTLWEANRMSMINYLRQGTYGIHGKVVDSISTKNIQAEISIPRHDKLNSSLISDSLTGRFFRYLKEGSYDLEIDAPGYRPEKLTNVSIMDYQRKNLIIKLLPEYILPLQNSVTVGPNPFNQITTVFLEMTGPGHVFFRLYDIYGTVLYDEFGYFPAGYNEYLLQPHVAPGVYLLTIKFETRREEFRLIKLND